MSDLVDADAPTLAPGQQDEPAAAARGATLGRYVILDELGRGGMGVVYAAYDPTLDRRVALKLLRAPGAGSAARLLREAQALARLSHPAVITVHDVGMVDGQVFFAMEYVRGRSLSAWLVHRPRTPDEILAVFLEAGAGLVAIHAAGLVHRDFKPDNVMVRRDGRVVVMDLGLARPGGDESADATDTPGAAAPGGLDAALTMTGDVLGTPAYMAPEQHLGREVDARADQFAFCVALYEALCGARPFAAPSREALAAAVLAGEVREASGEQRLPARMRAALRRGLATDPGERFPSMATLLEALAPRRRAWPGRAVAAVAVVAALAGLVLVLGRDPAAAVCAGGERHLAGIWDDARRAALHQGFARSPIPYANAAWRSTERALDAYAARWVAAHAETCEATRVHGEQSTAVLDRRMACLDRKRGELRALVDALAAPEPATIERAARAAQELGSLAECSRRAAVAGALEIPRDAARGEAIDALLARARASFLLARHEHAIADAERAATLAEALDYRSARARARFRIGMAHSHAGDAATAEAALLDAVESADAARDDRTRFLAAAELIYVTGVVGGRHDDAGAWLAVARGAVERVDEPVLAGELLNSLGMLRVAEGRYDEAEAAHRQALALRQRHLGPESVHVGISHNNLAVALQHRGAFREATGHLEHAHRVFARLYGDAHPLPAATLYNLANVELDVDRAAAALPRFERVLAIRRAELAAGDPRLGEVLNAMGVALQRLGRHDEADARFREALAIYERAPRPDDAELAAVYNNLATNFMEQGRLEDARIPLEDALARRMAALGADHPRVALVHFNLGDLHLAAGRAAEALRHHERALAIWSASLPADHPDLADAHDALARVHRARGDESRARTYDERARRIREASVPAP